MKDSRAPVVLLLAAGASRRFGADKRLARMDGELLIDRAMRCVRTAGLPLRVVLRADDALDLDISVPIIRAGRAGEGMGCSIADAVAELPSDSPGCLILPVDLPLLRAETIAAVASQLREDNIVQPICNGRPGHPVGFGRQFLGELKGLQGDEGAKGVLAKHRDRLLQIEVDDEGIFLDVDTPEELRAVEEKGRKP